jgi:hypothetical protein
MRQFAIIVVAGAALVLALATPASAMPGLVRVSQTSPGTSVGKTLTTACPAGSALIGGGSRINGGGGGQTHLTTLGPIEASQHSWRTVAAEDQNGFAGLWSVTTQAICADLPDEYAVTIATSPLNSSSKTVSATCPHGMVAIGPGAAISVTVPGTELILDMVRPNADLHSVTAAAFEDDDGFAGDWQLTVRAVCVPRPDGLVLVTAVSTTDSTGLRSVTADCPEGTVVHGSGFDISGAVGEVGLTALDQLTPTSVRARAEEDEDGYASAWSLRGYALCAE